MTAPVTTLYKDGKVKMAFMQTKAAVAAGDAVAPLPESGVTLETIPERVVYAK